jgi:CRISPR-associated endonuclease/helicase Cas3
LINFAEAFCALTEKRPFPWQERAFKQLTEGNPPKTVSLPTGTGKTSLIPIWLIALAWQAEQGHPFSLPRRLVWVVNRRVVVDQATDEATSIISRLDGSDPIVGERKHQVLRDLGTHLRGISLLGSTGAPPISVSTLRGQLADNREWALDPSRPAIIIGTVDMIGSRLLFSGYGDGKYRRPLHAGLLGQDSWIVLDEAHLTPAFAELLISVRDIQQMPQQFTPFCVSLLSATQRNNEKAPEGSSIVINQEDTADALIGKRLAAKKSLRIHQLGEKDIDVDVIVRLALSYREARVRVLIYLKSPKQVTKVADRLKQEAPGCPVRVLTGTLRGLERDELAVDPVFSGFRAALDRPKPQETHYLVSTSAGEVGADLDADHLVCDIVPLDSLIQRLGRVNRLGMGSANIDMVVPARPDKEGKNVRVIDYLKSLPQVGEDHYSVSPTDLKNPPIEAFSESPRIIPLARNWLDMWSQTSIRDDDCPGRPEVAPWLHGVVEDLPETHVAWREDVQWLAQKIVSDSDCARVFEVYDIRPHEQLQEPTGDIRDKLVKLAQTSENAISPVILLRKDGSLAWRGRLEGLLQDESDRKISLKYSTVLLAPSVGGSARRAFFHQPKRQPSMLRIDSNFQPIAVGTSLRLAMPAGKQFLWSIAIVSQMSMKPVTSQS